MTDRLKPQIVASTAVSEEAARAKSLGADMVEIRMDLARETP